MSGYECVTLQLGLLFDALFTNTCTHTHYLKSFLSLPLTFFLWLLDLRFILLTLYCWLFKYSHRASLYFNGSLKNIFLLLQDKELNSFGWLPLQCTCFCLLLDIFCLFLWVLIVSLLHVKDLLRAVCVCLMEEFYIVFLNPKNNKTTHIFSGLWSLGFSVART